MLDGVIVHMLPTCQIVAAPRSNPKSQLTAHAGQSLRAACLTTRSGISYLVAFLRTQDEIPDLFVIASPSRPPLLARCSSGTDCWSVLPTRRPVAVTDKEEANAA